VSIPIGEKVNYVRRAPQARDHTCHWPGCTAMVPPAMWGCRAHWYLLPREIRQLFWRTYRPGQEIDGRPSRAYIVAARAAQEWIREQGGAS
jgi:hypothetical protein